MAALANAELRPVIGRLLLGETLDAALAGVTPRRHARVAAALSRAGLLTDEAHTGARLNPTVFATLLTQSAEPRREGIERFLDARGERIQRFPSSLHDRDALLAWAVDRALQPAEMLDERTITERLERMTADPVLLRRALVDAGLVERERDGSGYRRAGGEAR